MELKERLERRQGERRAKLKEGVEARIQIETPLDAPWYRKKHARERYSGRRTLGDKELTYQLRKLSSA